MALVVHNRWKKDVYIGRKQATNEFFCIDAAAPIVIEKPKQLYSAFIVETDSHVGNHEAELIEAQFTFIAGSYRDPIGSYIYIYIYIYIWECPINWAD